MHPDTHVSNNHMCDITAPLVCTLKICQPSFHSETRSNEQLNIKNHFGHISCLEASTGLWRPRGCLFLVVGLHKKYRNHLLVDHVIYMAVKKTSFPTADQTSYIATTADPMVKFAKNIRLSIVNDFLPWMR